MDHRSILLPKSYGARVTRKFCVTKLYIIPRSHETYWLPGPVGLGGRTQARGKHVRNDPHTMLR